MPPRLPEIVQKSRNAEGMSEDRIERRLWAILAADVAGYSRLMGADEEGTLAALTAHRHEHVDPCIARHHGKVVKNTGDGFLAEFASVVDAVRCAVDLQKGMAARNAGVGRDKRLEFRIGVNVGDIVEQDGDIFGDGVNIAARLQALADPGGICLSARAQEDAAGKIDVEFDDLGDQQLKNIARPVHAYRVIFDGQPPFARRRSRQPLPQKPSLAVLPFQNMSGDPEQDYFADGVVEDIITALSRFRSFAVIARNSSFVYKGHAVDVRQIARELGVRYVLEGSVRRSGQRVRLTAQLIDADTGAHLWARNFDGALRDIFDVQDRITESVVAVVEPQIQRAEIERSRRERPGSVAAYDLYLAAMEKFHAATDKENAEAYALLTKAIALEPNNGLMLAQAAQLLQHRMVMGWAPLSPDDRGTAHELVHRALANARGDAPVLASAGLTLIANREYDLGFAAMKAAVEANPNHFDVVIWAGVGNIHCGSLEDARTYFERALRLSPADPHAFVALTGIAHVLLVQGDNAGALAYAERATGLNMNYDPAYWMMIAANVRLGRMQDARRWFAKFKTLSPGVTIRSIRQGQPMQDPARLAPILEGLRAVGLEEG